ncbi:MAG: hypothetical protein ABIJ09_12225 [Pseudomonadota bacterium]
MPRTTFPSPLLGCASVVRALAIGLSLIPLWGSVLRAQADASSECRTGSDGRVACGYACRMGSDGRMACADTPDGTCAMGSDGQVVCTALRGARFAPVPGVRAECRMGSDGHVVCGFTCRMGSDGHVACADTPNGSCAMGSDGRAVCSRLAASQAAGNPEARSECKMGSDGHVVCGFACKMGSDGHVACANTPDGTCAMGSDGHVVCTRLVVPVRQGPQRRRPRR